MTSLTVNNGTNWRLLLERAEQRCDDGDTIGAMAKAVEAQLQGRQGDATQLVDELSRWEECAGGQAEQIERLQAERDELRQENSALADTVEARQRDLEDADRYTNSLRTELANAIAEVERLRGELESRAWEKVIEHHHTYEWASPDELPRDCACGHPYPRDLREVEEVTPDTTTWDELVEMARLELEEMGWPGDAS